MTNSSQPTSFTPAEQSRLVAIKAADVAGLYRDTICEEQMIYHFTPDELERLLIYRRAIQAGFFTDQLDRHESTNGD